MSWASLAAECIIAPDDGHGPGSAASPAQRFRPLHADQLDSMPPLSWLVPGEIPRVGFGAVYGPTGSGKSFYCLDRALTLAQDSPVVYVAGEGVGGYGARKLAWCRHHGKGAGQLYFVRDAPNLLDASQVGELIDAIAPLAPVLVVLDTLARCLVGGDENSAQSMGIFIAACDRIHRETGATVLVVHHTGKAGQSERGSSALRAACDFLLGLSEDDGLITLTCEKVKDGEVAEPRGLRLVAGVQTGRTLPSGEPETSCVILPSSRVMMRGTVTKNGRLLLETLSLEVFLDTGGRQASLIKACGIPEGSFARAISALIRDGFVTQDAKGEPYRITAKGQSKLSELSRSYRDTSR